VIILHADAGHKSGEAPQMNCVASLPLGTPVELELIFEVAA
jgi:hypothetical protein